jgi:hypothetical protein
MTVRYTPGSLRVVVGAGGVVVLGAEATADAAAAVWRSLAGTPGLGGIVDALAAGGPLSGLPSFAAVLDDGDVRRIAVRGALSVHTGAERIDGAAASTWSERSLAAGTALAIGAGDADAGDALPLRDGIAPAAAVWIGEPAAAPAPTAAPAPAAADTPAAAAPAPPAPSEPVQPHSVAEVHDLAAPAAPPAPAAAPLMPPPAPAVAATASGPEPEKPVTTRVIDVPAPVEAMPELDDDVEATIISGAGSAPEDAGDSDGETISLAEARALRAAGKLPPLAPPLAPAPPPRAAGRLHISNGQVVALDRAVVIGRRPHSTRVSGADLPQLVAVDSPGQDISRNHLEVRVEGDSILATDLDTTNGTTLLRPGAQPVRLHPGERTMVLPGDVLDLGDGVTVRVDAP